MKYEILEPDTDLESGDLCMFVYVSKNGNVKYKCGKHSTYTEPLHDGDARYSVLADGAIPQWQGYGLVVAVRPHADFEDVPIFDDMGESRRE